MAVKRDYYEVLGIGRDADEKAIKRAYRKLAKKYHPDTNSGNAGAEAKFKEITEAYTILNDPEKRKLYDQFGHAAFDGTGAESGAYGYGGGPQGSYQEFHFEGGDMGDIFGDIFGSMFGGRGQRAGRNSQGFSGFSGNSFHDGFYESGFGGRGFSQKGSDVEAEVSISFDEAVSGCEKTIRLQDPNAGGRVQSLKVRIPAGIDDGKSIRLRGKGRPGSGGGEPGDLMLKVRVGAKAGFERKGMDVYTTVQIPFTTAVFGGEAVVPTLYGNVICKIREGTQSGSKIRLRGKGIVSMKDSSVHGDQYVTVAIQVPQNLSPEAKRKLREYEAVTGQNRRRYSA